MKSLNQSSPAFYFLFILIIGSFFSCKSPDNKVTEVKFLFGPDDSGTLSKLIDQFNKSRKDIRITYEESARSTNTFYEELEDQFAANSVSFDAFAGDVIWTASFVHNQYVEDLTDRFFAEFSPEQFVKPAMESTSYQYRIWGLPWFTDAGLLFYRKDLIEQAPRTWNDLIQIAQNLQKKGDVEYGYVFQGAAYEGGVTNLCEFIWNAGGNILFGDLYLGSDFDQETDPGIITVNSESTLTGLKEIDKIMRLGVAPKEVYQYRELESGLLFRDGKAAFMRSWPSSYALLLDKKSIIRPEQVGIAKIPTSDSALQSFSCLGGWNLMINAQTSDAKKDGAWEFFKFLVSPESQKFRAEQAGMLPSLRILYQDESLLASSPTVAMAKEVLSNTRVRPKSPFYPQISEELATVFNQVLIGVTEPEEAMNELDGNLKNILTSHQHIQ